MATCEEKLAFLHQLTTILDQERDGVPTNYRGVAVGERCQLLQQGQLGRWLTCPLTEQYDNVVAAYNIMCTNQRCYAFNCNFYFDWS